MFTHCEIVIMIIIFMYTIKYENKCLLVTIGSENKR